MYIKHHTGCLSEHVYNQLLLLYAHIDQNFVVEVQFIVDHVVRVIFAAVVSTGHGGLVHNAMDSVL